MRRNGGRVCECRGCRSGRGGRAARECRGFWSSTPDTVPPLHVRVLVFRRNYTCDCDDKDHTCRFPFFPARPLTTQPHVGDDSPGVGGCRGSPPWLYVAHADPPEWSIRLLPHRESPLPPRGSGRTDVLKSGPALIVALCRSPGVGRSDGVRVFGDSAAPVWVGPFRSHPPCVRSQTCIFGEKGGRFRPHTTYTVPGPSPSSPSAWTWTARTPHHQPMENQSIGCVFLKKTKGIGENPAKKMKKNRWARN